MARPHVYNWPAADTTAICALQDLAGAGTALINGDLATPSGPPGSAYSVVLPDIGRTVSLTSANDLHLVHFTITGFMNGVAVTSTIVGPNANTVETPFGTNFDVITSVTTDAAAAAFSVGTGKTGVTHWFESDIYTTPMGMSIQVFFTGTTIKYSFQTTLDDVQTKTPNPFTPISAMTDAATDQFGSLLAPTRYSRILMSVNTTADVVMSATFVQQGMK